MPQALGLFLFNIGAPLWLANFAVSAIGSALINLSIGIGLSAIASAFVGRPSAPSIKPSDVQQQLRQTLPPRRKSYGTLRLSGPVWWWQVGSGDRLFVGVLLNHGRIAEITEYWIDENQVEVDGGTDQVTTGDYVNGSALVYLHSRFGSPSETGYTEIEEEFNVGDVRGDGTATLLGTFDVLADPQAHQQLYPNGWPQIRVTADTSVAWDPRDPSQIRENSLTWQWTENAVVAFLNYLLDPDGHGIPWTRIEPNLAEWILAADICDEETVKADGTVEARYRIAGTYQLTDKPADTFNRFLSTFDGRCWQKSDGTIGIRAGRYVAPTVTIAAKDIIQYRAAGGQDILVRLSAIKAQFLSPENGYVEQDAEPWPNGADISDSDDRVTAVDLTWVPSHAQARRLMKRLFLRQTSPWSLSLVTNLAGLRAMDEQFITVDLEDELGLVLSCEIQSFKLNIGDRTCALEVIALGPELDEWDMATEEGVGPQANGGLNILSRFTGEQFSNFSSTGQAFDGDTSASGGSCASGPAGGYIGKSLPSPRSFGRAILYGSNVGGFVSGSDPSVTITAWGKNGDQPSNPDAVNQSTNLGSVTFTDTFDESGGRIIESTDHVSKWDHIFFIFTNNGDTNSFQVAEIELFLWGFE